MIVELLRPNASELGTLTAAATLPWARSRIGLARRVAARLDVYFEVMHILVEQIDLGLPEIANWLRQAPEDATSDGTSFSSPEVEREDEL
ncbi:MAG: hypothetical protein ACOX1P_04105 [Thermoguttaceae bacterium]|jgi:hypothetical protein